MRTLYRNLLLVALGLILLLPVPLSPIGNRLPSQPHAGLVISAGIDGGGLGNECGSQGGAGGSHGGC